jgi:hypothetical protein
MEFFSSKFSSFYWLEDTPANEQTQDKPFKSKKPYPINSGRVLIKNRQRLTLPDVIPVPSAQAGLTSLFGMGRGEPHRYSHLKVLTAVALASGSYLMFYNR